MLFNYELFQFEYIIIYHLQKNAPHSPKKVTKVIKVEKKKVLETSEVNSSKVTPQNICIGGKVDDPFAFQKLKAKIEMDIKWTPI